MRGRKRLDRREARGHRGRPLDGGSSTVGVANSSRSPSASTRRCNRSAFALMRRSYAQCTPPPTPDTSKGADQDPTGSNLLYRIKNGPACAEPRARATAFGPARTPNSASRQDQSTRVAQPPVEAATIAEGGTPPRTAPGDRRRTRYAARHRATGEVPRNGRAPDLDRPWTPGNRALESYRCIDMHMRCLTATVTATGAHASTITTKLGAPKIVRASIGTPGSR